MKSTYIDNFLDSLYGDKKRFVEVYGTEKLFDPKFMLIADVMSENRELLSDVILEALQKVQERYPPHHSCTNVSLSVSN